MSVRWRVGRGEHVPEGPVDGGLLPPDGLGQPGELPCDPLAHHSRLHAHPGQDGTGDPVGLVENGGEHVLRSDLRVVGGAGPLDGGRRTPLGS